MSYHPKFVTYRHRCHCPSQCTDVYTVIPEFPEDPAQESLRAECVFLLHLLITRDLHPQHSQAPPHPQDC